MKLEDILPQIRSGKRVRRKSWEQGTWFDPRDEEYTDALADDWELAPERVADYDVGNGKIETHPIGKQPGNFEAIPGSFRDAPVPPVKYRQTLYLLNNGLISYNRRGLDSLIVETREIEWSVE